MKDKNLEKIDQKISFKTTKSMNHDLNMLKDMGFNPSKFIRDAVEKELKEVKQKFNLVV
ncbi:MAG TPA: hypothetical protein VM577_03615 [Anaerovoracaceae bacterium]|nr:hypothetical protein [Anaerovoracaceae bacterium]